MNTSSAEHGPWIDLHAHPGRCFLAGYEDTAPMVQLLGASSAGASVRGAAEAGVCCVSVSTVADLAVLRPNADGGLGAGREFEPGEARADHDQQLRGLSTLFSDVRQVRGSHDIVAAHDEGTGSAFVSCEGADFLDGQLEGLGDAFDVGARMVTLVHYRVNELGDIQTETPRHGGLTSFGREVVGEMNRLGMIVDLAHATFDTTIGALEVSSAPIVISHSHLAGPGAAHPRLLTEDHARVVADAGGLVGAWPSGVSATTLGEYVDEVCRLVELIGVDHVAIGSDLDANYKPVLTEYQQFNDVAAELAIRGFSSDEADAILGGNALRLFERICR
jgi:membrane dipeptidase